MRSPPSPTFPTLSKEQKPFTYLASTVELLATFHSVESLFLSLSKTELREIGNRRILVEKEITNHE